MSNSDSSFSRGRKAAAGSLAFVVGAGALLVAPTAFAAAETPVALNAVLQACINDKLDRPASDDVTEGDLAGLTGSLVCVGGDTLTIDSLDGLEFATGLEELDLIGGTFTDLSPLDSLVNLEALSLSGNSELTSLDSLGTLASLVQLDISQTGIENFDDINNKVPNLTYLDASYLNIQGFLDLELLEDLNVLILSNVVSNVWGELDDFNIDLTALDVSNSEFNTYSWLDGLSVIALNMSETYITDLAAFAGVVNLETLELSNNNLTNLSELNNISGLRVLNVSNNNIYDISTISGMNLDYLFADGQTYHMTAGIGNEYGNVFRDYANEPIAFPDPEYHADINSFIFTTPGLFTTTFSVPTTTGDPDNLGPVTVFSGTYNVDVMDEDTGLAPVQNVQVSPDGADPRTAAFVSFTPNEAATSYTVSFINVDDNGDVTNVDFTPEQVAGGPLRVSTLTPGTDYHVVVTYLNSMMERSPSSSTLIYRTAPAEVTADAPALTNLKWTPAEGKNGGVLNFTSVAEAGGTAGNGDVTQFTLRYRLAGTTGEWKTLTTPGDNATSELQLMNLNAGTYDIEVFYHTSTDVSSLVAPLSVQVTGSANVNGDVTVTDNAGNLNNSASEVDLSGAGLAVGGALMLAAAGAVVLGARRKAQSN